MALLTQFSFGMTPRYTKSADLIPGGLSIAPQIAPPQLTLADGVGSGQANRVFLDTGSLPASDSVDLTLDDGTLLDPFGDPITFTKLNGIYVRCLTGADGLILGNAGSGVAFVGPFGTATGRLVIPTGGWVPLIHPTVGWPVVPGTGNVLRIANGGATGVATYDVALVGADA